MGDFFIQQIYSLDLFSRSVAPMDCRTDGLSHQWTVGPVDCQTNGLYGSLKFVGADIHPAAIQ